MKWFVCNDCAEIFDETEAKTRPSEMEDSFSPWTTVLLCPGCGSDDLAAAQVCPLCGKPHIPTEHGFCDGCYNYTDAALKAIAWVRGEGEKPEEALQDLICKIFGW